MSDPSPVPSQAAAAGLCFGPGGRFELQAAERRLLVDGRPVALGGRALDLLIALSARPDHLLTKSELLDRVWPGLVVEESNLQIQVGNLRRILGGDAIATVPGRGYRFVAPLRQAAPEAVPVPVPVATAAPPAAAPAAAAVAAPQRLFGRGADRARLEQLLRTEACVTLVGPAGVGKTSLARVLLAGSEGQRVWVDLGPLTQGEQLPGALARALGAPLAEGEAAPQLLRTLQERSWLIVLDNAEHLVDACAGLATLLSTLPGVRLLVTSQLPLAVVGEAVHRLEPLALPAGGAAAGPATARATDATTDGTTDRATATPFATSDATSDATAEGDGALALLLARIRAADHRFVPGPRHQAALAEICAQLDGLPLALEMAAARVPLMGVQGVRDALAQRFALLTRGHRDAPARHRTLHDALDWSYRLLSADAQALFRTLGVFAGGFSLELMLAVTGCGSEAADGPRRWALIDGLAALADRSLVAVSTDEPPRYRLLDTMRAFALQALAAAGEMEAARRQHALALAELLWRLTPEDLASYELGLREMENAREAFTWAREHDLCRAAQIAARATRISTFDVWRNECTQWLRALQPALAGPAAQHLPGEVQASYWTEMARNAVFTGSAEASGFAQHALAWWQRLDQPERACFAASVWVRAVPHAGEELDRACAALQAQAARVAQPSTRLRLWLHGALTRAALVRRDYAAVLQGRLAEMTLAHELGAPDSADAAESNVVDALNRLQRHAEAAERGQALLARIDRRNGESNANLPWVISALSEALIETGRLAQARALLPRSWMVARRFDSPTMLPMQPLLAAAQGRFEAAAQLLGATLREFETRSVGFDDGVHEVLARVRDAAVQALGAARVEQLVAEGRLLDEAATQALAAG